jgi:hypothetical protein
MFATLANQLTTDSDPPNFQVIIQPQNELINDFSRSKIDATVNELEEERSLVSELLPK